MSIRLFSAVSGFFLIVILAFSGCALPFDFSGVNDGVDTDESGELPPGDPGTGASATAIPVSGGGFTIAWNAADGDVTGYEVYYRSHGGGDWVQLGSAPAIGNPTFHVTTGILTYGTYDFAVRAVLVNGETTEYHTSLDSTANPDEGWYVDWSGV